MNPQKRSIEKHSDEVQSKIRSSMSINGYQQCVEELILNSLDSAASCIIVRINVGTGLVQVVDNGSGINRESMRLIGTRYASSKSPYLQSRREAPGSHGYRGEALASIACLCKRLEIITKYSEDGDSVCKLYENGKWSLKLSEEPRPYTGTTISVCDLFYQSLHQRKAKSEKLVMADVVSKVQTLAVVHCTQASFTLRDERCGKILVQTTREKYIKEAISANFGPTYCSQLRPVSGTHDQLQIQGVVSCQAYPSTKLRVVSLNKRILRYNKLHQAIERELKQSLINLSTRDNEDKTRHRGSERIVTQSKNFLYVVNLMYDSQHYDIMLDPDKAKVEFEDWDQVIDSLTKLVRKFLFVNNLNKGATNAKTFDSVQYGPLDLSLSPCSQKSAVLYDSDDEQVDFAALSNSAKESMSKCSKTKNSISATRLKMKKKTRVKNRVHMTDLDDNLLSPSKMTSSHLHPLQPSLEKPAVKSSVVKKTAAEEPSKTEISVQDIKVHVAHWILNNFSEQSSSEALEAETVASSLDVNYFSDSRDTQPSSDDLSLKPSKVLKTLSTPDVVSSEAFNRQLSYDLNTQWHHYPTFQSQYFANHSMSPAPSAPRQPQPMSAPADMYQSKLKRHLHLHRSMPYKVGKRQNTENLASPVSCYYPGRFNYPLSTTLCPLLDLQRSPYHEDVYSSSPPFLFSAPKDVTQPTNCMRPEIPSYATPLRSNQFSNIITDQFDAEPEPINLAALSPALQHIFSPLAQ